MTTSEHPSLEDLLLWQSGELSPEQAAEIAAHVAACPQCKKDVSEAGDLFGDVASINAEAMEWQMHRKLDAEQHASWFTRIFHPVQRGWIPASAGILIVALVLYTFTDLTQEARADALLAKAVEHEDVVGPHFLSFNTGGVRCFAEGGSSEAHLLSASSSNSCHLLSGRLLNAGWSYNDLLSAKGFQSWRTRLHEKTDSIHKFETETEIRTSTENSPIRSATLRLRNVDLHPVAESLELVGSGDEPAATIRITEASSSEITSLSAPVAPPAAVLKEDIAVAHFSPAVSPLDLAEAHALLALHNLDADRNTLMNVQRGQNAVKIWGVVPSDSEKNAILTALNRVPDVTVDVRTELEEKRAPQPLPWHAYQGDGPPLAQDQLRELFPNDPQALQEFVNTLNRTTLKLAAEARNRDALLPLAKRLTLTEQASSLDQAAGKLQHDMAAQTASLAQQLQPLIGRPITAGHTVLSYPQAVELYKLVHQVAYMSNSQAPIALDDALSRIRRLLSGK